MQARGEPGQRTDYFLRSLGEFFRTLEHQGFVHLACLVDDEFDNDGAFNARALGCWGVFQFTDDVLHDTLVGAGFALGAVFDEGARIQHRHDFWRIHHRVLRLSADGQGDSADQDKCKTHGGEGFKGSHGIKKQHSPYKREYHRV